MDKSFTGVILVILAVSVTIICVGLSLKLAQAAHPVIYFVFSVLFIYFAISVKDAESTMDGIVAPLFYAFLGGPVFAWAYKAINTLDSMVGYRNERFICFGKAAAKLDGLINLIPAKITCFLIFISGWGYRSGWLASGKWVGRYFFNWG